jgi:hypothetical protein
MALINRVQSHFAASLEAKQRTLEAMGLRIAQAAEHVGRATAAGS